MSELPFILDDMTVDDIPAVMSIERKVFSAMWTSGIYRRELTANPWSHYLVLRATRPGLPPILAYGGVWKMDLSAHIPTIATHPQHQGKGLGSYLLLHLLLLGEAMGCREATLEVRASNHAAQRLYLRYGFDIAGIRHRYYNDNGEDALIMTRPSLVREELQAELLRLRPLLQQRWLEDAQTFAH
ncbi:MAG TPA: ribosomal-protein-alanine N-acetyltransferase [Anaerolineae bacterium]|nr:ribosomal protein S18-alanine N-acetyltransferase [Caldilineae bacterium]HID33879.1 ribosomal-protein-alanine N-acetyltransferase [Anaerolineae bacterium]HIQ12552.1 ribosomal-protein-alanine N-acetyltransferase [Caldilineales bacterium]